MAARRALTHARAVSPTRVAALAPLAFSLLLACGDDTSGSGGSGGAGATTTTTSTDAASSTTGSQTTTASGTGASTGDGGGSSGTGGATGTGGGTGTEDRPYEVFVPSSYDASTPMPLIILLHGYTATAAIQEAYLRIEPLAEELGFLYIVPEGTVDSTGENFWNATDACCNLDGSDVDDSGYLRAIVDETSARYAVDPLRVHFIGHSNGGFMSHRMACDHAVAVASIASLAGAQFADPADCQPSEPVAALQIHGTEDATIAYDGGVAFGTYPSAMETAETWAAKGGCSETPTELAARDLADGEGFDGEESGVLAWTDGCDPGGAAELWTIEGAGHVPSLSDTFSRQAVEWLLAHPKP